MDLPRPHGYLCILYISRCAGAKERMHSGSKPFLHLIDWPLRWVGNWLTQWQRIHLYHHWQQAALRSSNFLQLHQIVALIASSQPGRQPPPSHHYHHHTHISIQHLYLPQRSPEGCDKFGAFRGNQQSANHLDSPHKLEGTERDVNVRCFSTQGSDSDVWWNKQTLCYSTLWIHKEPLYSPL